MRLHISLSVVFGGGSSFLNPLPLINKKRQIAKAFVLQQQLLCQNLSVFLLHVFHRHASHTARGSTWRGSVLQNMDGYGFIDALNLGWITGRSRVCFFPVWGEVKKLFTRVWPRCCVQASPPDPERPMCWLHLQTDTIDAVRAPVEVRGVRVLITPAVVLPPGRTTA